MLRVMSRTSADSEDASKSEDTRMLEKKEVEGVLEYRAQQKKKEA